MEHGQQKFLDYMMDKVKEGSEISVKEKLEESFQRMREGKLNKAYMAEMMESMKYHIKDEFIDDVKNVFENFSSNMK